MAKKWPFKDRFCDNLKSISYLNLRCCENQRLSTDRSLFSGKFCISEPFLAVAGRVKQEVA